MSPETARKLVDVLVAFLTGSILLYGAEWAAPKIRAKAEKAADTPAIRRARAAAGRAISKGSWGMNGVRKAIGQRVAGK